MKATPAQESKPKQGGLSPRAIAWLVLAASVLIAFLAARVASNFQARETQARFDAQAELIFAQIGKRLDDFENITLGLQGLFIGSGQVGREEFHRYAENLNLKQRLPGLQALSFQRYVRHAEKAAFVERVRRDRSLDSSGYPAFTIRPEGERADYVVIDYVEPMAPNLPAFGVDAGTQPGNIDAIRLARDTGQMTVSEPMQIAQNPGGAPRLVLRAPIYRAQAPTATVAQRREALTGFVVLTIDAQAVFGEFFGKLGSEGARIVIEYSGPAQPNGAARRIAFFDSGAPSDEAPLLTRGMSHEFGGRNWGIAFAAYPAWQKAQPGGNTAALIFLGGSLVGLLLALLYLAQARSRERAQRLAGQMTHDLRLNQQRLQVVADLSMDWFWEQDEQHRFISVIGRAHDNAGLDATRVLGKTRWELAPEALGAAEWEAHRRKLDAREPFDLEYVFVTGNGRRRWLKSSGAPRFDEHGAFLGYHGTGRDVTDQVEADTRLREQAQLLQTVFEHMKQGINVIDKDLRLAGSNRRYGELLGVPETLLRPGTRFEDYARYNALRGEYGEGDVEEIVRNRVAVARRGEAYRLRRTRPDGMILEIVGTPLPEGGMIITYDDITERENFQHKLQSERDFSQHLIDSIPGIFYLISPQGRYLLWNRNFETVAGYSAQEMAAASPLDFFEGADKQLIADKMAEVFANGSASTEALFVTKNGDKLPYYFTGERLILEDGTPALIGVGHDISESKQAKEALAQQGTILQATLEAMDQGISVVDKDLYLRALNRRFYELLDFPEAMTRQGATFADFVRFNAERGEYGPCDVEAKVAEMVERARHPQPHVFRRKRPDGRIIEVRGNPMPDGGFVTTYSDVTEQEHAQQALRLSERRYRNLIEFSPDAVFVHRNHIVLIANPATARLWKLGSAEEAIGRNVLDFVHPGSQEKIKARIASIESDHALFRLPWAEAEYLRTDGTAVPVEASATLIELEDGPAILSVARDLTERKIAEKAIRELNVSLEQRVRERTAELEASNQELESFSYSVSHDLRAPLRALNGFSHLIEEEYAHHLDANGLNYLSRIRAASKRMGELIDNLLDLARVSRQELKRVPVDFSALANEIRASLEEQAPERKVSWQIASGLAVRADPVLAKALLENLLRNAWKFTAECAVARIEFSATAHDGETVYCVRDNGAGFEMAYADKLFKPFQRLHDAKRFEGTGIGLAIVHRVLRRHGGRIWAEGAPGEGAAFRFTLP